MFKNRVLRKIFGPKSDEVTGEWRRLHNEESVLLTKYYWSDKIKKSGACGKQERRVQDFGGKT